MYKGIIILVYLIHLLIFCLLDCGKQRKLPRFVPSPSSGRPYRHTHLYIKNGDNLVSLNYLFFRFDRINDNFFT